MDYFPSWFSNPEIDGITEMEGKTSRQCRIFGTFVMNTDLAATKDSF